MSDTMTALVPTPEHRWEQRQVPVPDPGPGQVRIRAVAGAINNAEIASLDAVGEDDDPGVAGFEAAGTVEAVGDGVDAGLVGRRVATSTSAAFAQHVLADARHLVPVPEGVELEQAVALPTAMLTEHGALRAGGFEAGQSVLVTGATSAIGLVGVQIARELGASTIVASTRSADKAQLLRERGVDAVVDTSAVALDEGVREATGGEGVDLVLDHVGGAGFPAALASLRKHGTLVQIGRLDQTRPEVDLDVLAYGRLTVVGVSFGQADELADLIGGAVDALLPAIESGRITPVVDEVLTFEQADEAAARVREGRALGKVVLRIP